MKTEILKIDSINNEIIYKTAGDIIKDGGLVAFPTETVYGLGGDALNAESSAKIYEAKGRPSDNPLIVHVSDVKSVEKIAEGIDDKAKLLMTKFWPGPLTIVFRKKEIVPYSTTGGLDTVAVRMPDNKCAIEFIKAAGGYIAAPSANKSGRPSPTKARHVYEDLEGRIDLIIDGGDAGIGVESTIVDLSEDIPTLLRPGYISLDMLKDVLGEVKVDPAILGITSDGIKPKAPGMKYRHYAPKGDMYIVSGNRADVITEINRLSAFAIKDGKTTGIIATDESAKEYTQGIVRNIGSATDEESIAHNLYSVLREFDALDVELIYSEEFNTPTLGMAIMNRLMKAAGQKVLKV